MTAGADIGRFITLEGGEGAGKSTQARLLAAALAAEGLPVLRTREPGGSPGAEAIRGLLLGNAVPKWDGVAECMLHFAARREHLAATIRPALEAGMWVVCDRFADSTLAYQCFGQGVPRLVWDGLAELALDGLRPDLTLVLDIAPEAGLGRVWERAGRTAGAAPDRYETMGLAFHQRIHAGFRAIAEAEPERCVLLDATDTEAGVAAAILRTVRARLPR